MVGSKENYNFDLGVKRLNNSTEKTGNNAAIQLQAVTTLCRKHFLVTLSLSYMCNASKEFHFWLSVTIILKLNCF